MNYSKGKNVWNGHGISAQSLSPAPIVLPADRNNIATGFLVGSRMDSIMHAPPITLMQAFQLNNFNNNTQGGIQVGKMKIIYPAYDNIKGNSI